MAGEEARFHAAMPEHVRTVLKGKRVLLFKALLKEFKCPDLDLPDIMLGTDLVGVPSKSPFFDWKLAPATTTPKFALISERWQRKKLEAVNIHQDDPELAKILCSPSLRTSLSISAEGGNPGAICSSKPCHHLGLP